MKVKKWCKTLSKLLLFIGTLVAFSLAGKCDMYPNYPMNKVLIYSIVSALCFLPYFLIFIYESEDE